MNITTRIPDNNKLKLGAGDGFLLAASCAWGINFPIAKSVLLYMDPMVFSATRYLVAASFLFVLLIFQRERLAITTKEFFELAIIGFLGITLFQGGWAYGLNLTSASKASILVATAPVFGALIGSFRGERTSLVGWAGIFLSMIGVVILINNSLTEITIGAGSMVGDLLIIGAAAIWSIYTLISRPMVIRRGPIFVTAYGMAFGALFLTAISVKPLLEQDWSAIPAIGWVAWASTAFLGAALAFVWYCAGISRLGMAKGMSYSFFIPAVAIATSLLFFGEHMSLVQLFGAAIILLGVKFTRTG
ncbi:DMT family transporter [Sneathiella aquimaris]|uniref:DMT family transporter n=1 Tax=Sneathiella aquimaris TaxID=2599305 RepID=UPI00146D9F9C|nr:DMT family transporter [Sneathiella aquimaris]